MEDYYLSTKIDAADMPQLLRRAAQLAEHPAQSDMLLLATMTGLSYVMPHCIIEHGVPSHTYFPNLMTLVMAPPASGKGVMNLVRKMMAHIQDERRKESTPEIVLNGVVVQEEKERTAFIPGNSSSAAFFRLLRDNDGQGFLFETEMDVVSSTWKHDYANYSYAFRQAYEHETISQARKKKGDGYVEIENPRLSVLLSGTYNQLLPLMESRENGLASRFLCYSVDDVIPFDEKAIHGMNDIDCDDRNLTIREIDEQIYRMYHFLKEQDHDCRFVLTDQQAQDLRNFFHDSYLTAFNDMKMPLEFDSMMKRHAVTVLRLGMILSMTRWFEDHQLSESADFPETITPTDADFRIMMIMAETLIVQAALMMLSLPEVSGETIEIPTDHSNLLDALPKTFRTADAILKGEEMGMCQRTVEQCITEWNNHNVVTRVKKGLYTKVE